MAGALVLSSIRLRPLRINWLIVGNSILFTQTPEYPKKQTRNLDKLR
jgi:hypothetical protein